MSVTRHTQRNRVKHTEKQRDSVYLSLFKKKKQREKQVFTTLLKKKNTHRETERNRVFTPLFEMGLRETLQDCVC